MNASKDCFLRPARRSGRKAPALLAVAAALAALVAASCAGGSNIRVEPRVDVQAIEGTYRFILYGNTHFDDLETAAFLDVEGDGIEFEPYAPDFQYRVVEGLSAEEAVHWAESAFAEHTSYDRMYARRLALADGTTIGYELRPHYMRLFVGLADVLDIDYALRDGRLVIYVRLDPRLRDFDRDDGGRLLDDAH